MPGQGPTAQIIAIANQKGGVGKTTTTISLGAALAERGRRVLLIDLDPQFTLTRGVGVDPERPGPTVRDVLYDAIPLDRAIVPDIWPGIDVVPTNLLLAKADLDLANLPAADLRLKQALSRHGLAGYDYVLIDCPPSLGRLTLNAVAAASYLLVPVDSAPWALTGIRQLFELVEQVQQFMNPGLHLLGVLLTKYQANVSICQRVRRDVQRQWPEELFQATVRHSAKLVEAAYVGEPILHWNGKSPVADDYRALAQEVEERVQVAIQTR